MQNFGPDQLHDRIHLRIRSTFSVHVYAQEHTSIYIYSVSVFLCISIHRESGYDSEVDPIMKLIWSKVCITIYITISITSLITIVA